MIIGKVVCLEGEPDASESGHSECAITSFHFVWVEIMEAGLASAHLHKVHMHLTLITSVMYSAKPLLLDLLPSWPGLQLDCVKRGRIAFASRAWLTCMLVLLGAFAQLQHPQLNPLVLTSLQS